MPTAPRPSKSSARSATRFDPRYDVVILGGGLAGLALARQLLLYTDKRLLLLDKRRELPAPHQKVGESTVQVGGNYFSKVLDLEEHLLCEHFMKYNLRFYHKTAGRENRCLEDYSQAFIQRFSNVASYQLDRNKLEAELLRRNQASPRFTFGGGAGGIDVSLAADGAPHRVSFRRDGEGVEVQAGWVVDCSGRGRILARKLGLARPSAIEHGAAFLWVDGPLNIERLTDLSLAERRKNPDRQATGHLPLWLATTHFMGEGLWFWVIALQGKTSLGLTFDLETLDREKVSTAEKFIAWVCEEFPLFARDLPQREVLHFAGYPTFAHDCTQTISPNRWALSGEAGRFSDPFYSPGSDLIAIYNTLIVDAIATDDREALAAKARAYEQVMRVVYEAYVPSYKESYNVLGDAEAFLLKYTWELAIYFAFYVFPFLNDLFTELRFLPAYFRRFARLGPMNRNLQRFLSGYYRWVTEHRPPIARPVFHDFLELGPLAKAEKTFYRVGIPMEEARRLLGEQLESLTELARFSLAYLSSVVVDDPALLTHRAFVEAIDPADFPFDPQAITERWQALREMGDGEVYPWSFDPRVLEKVRAARDDGAALLAEAGAVAALTGAGGH